MDCVSANCITWLDAQARARRGAEELHHVQTLDGEDWRDATFCLEAILTSQPFRERPGTDSYLCAPEHRTEEPDLGRKVSLWMSPRLALYDYLALGGPEQSPLRRKVLHLDQTGWTQIVAALAHSGTRIPPDSLRCVP
jgi:hypothetical protein